jgi:hypothetical protein
MARKTKLLFSDYTSFHLATVRSIRVFIHVSKSRSDGCMYTEASINRLPLQQLNVTLFNSTGAFTGCVEDRLTSLHYYNSVYRFDSEMPYMYLIIIIPCVIPS